MRKLVLFMHVSLDGFAAGPKSEIDWVRVGEEMFDYAGRQTDRSDTALYGRVTYQLMENYWPHAGEKVNATTHDIQHSSWYNAVDKIVVSKTLKDANLIKTKIISENIPDEIIKLKQKTGKDIVIFGSPSIGHLLMTENLIDDYWLFINPVLLGQGIPMFSGIKNRTYLELISNNIFSSGVVCLHYQSVPEK